MKSLILLVVIALILAFGVSAECVDSDGGKDYTVKGTTTYTKGEAVISENIDACKDEGTLIEYFCDTSGKTTLDYNICECEDGICADLVEEAPVEEEEVVEEEEEPAEIPPQEIPSEEPEIPPKADYTEVWILVAVIVIIVVAAIVFLKVKQRKDIKEDKKETTKKK